MADDEDITSLIYNEADERINNEEQNDNIKTDSDLSKDTNINKLTHLLTVAYAM